MNLMYLVAAAAGEEFPICNTLCDTGDNLDSRRAQSAHPGSSAAASLEVRQTSDAMTQLNEAIARYHRILESYDDLGWVDALEHKLNASHLTAGNRRVAPVLRPHFITQRQYNNLVIAAEALYSAIDRIEKLALTNPTLMSRMQMLPAEKMLASVDPGYPYLSVTSLLDTHLNTGVLSAIFSMRSMAQ